MATTFIRFRGSLSPRVLARAAGMSVTHEGDVIVLWGTLSASELRALIEALLADDNVLVDVSGAPVGA